MSLDQVITRIIAGTKYLVHPQVLGTVVEAIPIQEIKPVVLLKAKTLHKSSETQLNPFLQVDDVYSPEFAQSVILTGSPEELDHEWSTLIPQNFSAVYTSASASITS